MTVDRAIELQTLLYDKLSEAMSPIPVSQAPLPDDRYVRMDAFVIIPLAQYRNYSQGSHSFLVHAFDSTPEGTNSTLWATQAMMQADAAIRQIQMPFASRILMQEMQVMFSPRSDGERDAHAFARYRVTIGET